MSNKETLEDWYKELERRMQKSPRYWWEYLKLRVSEWWWAFKYRNHTVYEIIEDQYPDLLHTAYWDEHPEDWNDGCFCAECRSYFTNE